jgi:hypothetical protein
MFNFNVNKENTWSSFEDNKLLIKTDSIFVDNYVSATIKNYHISLKDSLSYLNELKKNPFVNDKTMESIIDCVYKNIRLIQILKKNIRNKKPKIKYESPINEDLHFNKLSSYNKDEIINVKDSNNNRYWSFHYKDIINIIKNSILNNEDNFPSPLVPKNPYTNQEFTIENLYKIYFIINKYDLPLELNLYYKNNFNLKNMLYNHWMYFVKQACQNFIKNLNDMEFNIELKYALKNYVKAKDYDWNKMQTDKNLRNNFQKIVIRINLYDNIYCDENIIQEIKKDMLSIIDNNSYKKNKIRRKKIFKITDNDNLNTKIDLNDPKFENYVQDGIFMFGGNEKYRQVKLILDELISRVCYLEGETEEKNENDEKNNENEVESTNLFNIGISTPQSSRSRRSRTSRRSRRSRRLRNRNTSSRVDRVINESVSSTSLSELDNSENDYNSDFESNEEIFRIERNYSSAGTNTEYPITSSVIQHNIDNITQEDTDTTLNSIFQSYISSDYNNFSQSSDS